MKTSKTILILIVLISLLNSCRSEEGWTWENGDPNYEDKTFFSPPEWILGKWEADHPSYAGEKVVFQFTSDNFIDTFWGDLNLFYNNWGRFGTYITVKETKSNELYWVDINQSSTTYKFRIKKIDNKTILVEEGFREGTIVLKKEG